MIQRSEVLPVREDQDLLDELAKLLAEPYLCEYQGKPNYHRDTDELKKNIIALEESEKILALHREIEKDEKNTKNIVR